MQPCTHIHTQGNLKRCAFKFTHTAALQTDEGGGGGGFGGGRESGWTDACVSVRLCMLCVIM